MTKQFDWIPNSDLKTQILKAWEEYEQDPQSWRLNHYLALINEVPIEESLDYMKFDDPHQPSPLDCW